MWNVTPAPAPAATPSPTASREQPIKLGRILILIPAGLEIGQSEQHVSVTRNVGLTPADQILAFQFPANVINRERQRTSKQISPIKANSFFWGMMANSDLVRVSPFCRSANIDGADWLTPTSRASSLNPGGHWEDLRYAYQPPMSSEPAKRRAREVP